MVARNFNVELDESAGPVTEVFQFTMAPAGLRVRLHERAGVMRRSPLVAVAAGAGTGAGAGPGAGAGAGGV